MIKKISILVCLVAIFTITYGSASYASTITNLQVASSNMVTATTSAQTVFIVSPSSETIYDTDLLISVKSTEENDVTIKVFELKEDSKAQSLAYGPFTYQTSDTLNFYTTKISNIKAAKYKIQVESINKSTKAQNITKRDVTVKTKKDEDSKEQIFASPQSNTLQFFQTIFKNVFK